MVAYVASHASMCAADVRTGFGSHAWNRCFAQTMRHWQHSLCMTLRFGLNPPCEPAHIFLTALACSAQWTGIYTVCLDALLLSGCSTGMVIMCAAIAFHCDLPVDYVCYTQILNLFSHTPSPRPHAHRTRATLPHTHVCFDRVETIFGLDLSTP